MDKITNIKNEFRLKQWVKIIESCQASGMTIAAWCGQNNINKKSYYYYLKKLRTIACESKELPACNSEQPIVPLSFTQTKESSTAAITIHLPSVSIDIQEGASKGTIEAVLAALKNIC
jgi:hypothetical protein